MERSSSSSLKRPIVGVILGNKRFSTNGIHRYPRLKRLVEANKEANTTLIFFTCDDVELSRRKVSGIYFNESSNIWERDRFPLPDVIYVRGGRGKEIRDLLEQFERLGVKKINPIHAFNKGELYEQLNHDDKVRPFLPQTKNVENMEEIKRTVQKLGTVYVKARRGRKGTKVMRIEKRPGDSYVYSYSVLGRLVRKKVNSMGNLEKAVKGFFGDREVIVQKAIDLVTISSNRLVDFRAELQRDKQGNIDIVGICVRIGRKNAPITTHSEAFRYDDYLKKLFPGYSNQKINVLKNKIKAFLIDVYTGVEKKYGKFGEIGIDFAVDKKGKLWLIECNAQSAKVSIVKAYGTKARKAFLNPLEYAKKIANTSTNRSQSANRSRLLSRSSL
ncbi:YheC/YheD family endospore coat-associated protein [Paenibacillus tyrfis]|uniref:YheC/YheD family endospore coat-associated protein n=1 Tax=Paenibacillus tyrfis TaxID=1501230 RepID=UPI000B58CBFD|nr:YheC/YheD family protein [Paenibacillus tyrfis]